MTKKRPPRRRHEVRLSDEAYRRLQEYARRQGTQISQVTDDILTRFLDEQEQTS